MLDNYNFTGFINLFNIYPDFLYPVYEKDNELYFHNGEINSINDFDPLNESSKNRVIYLDDSHYHIICALDSYVFTKHSSPAYAFQESENVVFCSGLSTMYNYIKNFRTDDNILKKAIKNYIDECLTAMKESATDKNTSLISCKNALKDVHNWHSRDYYVLCKNNFQETESEMHDIINPLKVPSYHNVRACVPSFYVDDSVLENFMDHHYALSRPNIERVYREIAFAFTHNDIVETWKHKLKPFDVCSFSLTESKAPDPSFTPYDTSIKELTCLQKIGVLGDKSIYGVITPVTCYPSANKLPKTTDFSKLRLSFDKIIKRLSPMSDFYEICIKCQNFVIDKDEDHLLQAINHHLDKFMAMYLNKLLDDYLIQYIQSHNIETNYFYLEEINNNKD